MISVASVQIHSPSALASTTIQESSRERTPQEATPAFKARNALVRGLGISANAQVERFAAYHRVTANGAQFRVVADFRGWDHR